MNHVKNACLSLLLILCLCGCETPVCLQTAEPSVAAQPEGTKPAAQASQDPVSISSTLLVAGDAMCHMPQTYDALACGDGKTYDYTACMQYVKPWIESADFSVCNLETVFRKDKACSGFPNFNTPSSFGAALKDAGFDMVTTANNHCMDQGYTGLCDTLDSLDEMGLLHIGTYRTQEEFDAHMGTVMANVGGISVAFLDYTYGTNAIPVSTGRSFSVNLFNTDYLTTLSEPDYDKLIRELEYAKSLKPDLIAVMIHWGTEYKTKENSYQDKLSDFLIAHGADLVLGGHSHVPQPMEYRRVTLEDGTAKTGFVCFSLGNFVSAQNWDCADITALLQLTLTKDCTSGKASLTKVSYVPCLVINRENDKSPRFLILDAYRAMEEYKEGKNEYLTAGIYERLLEAVKSCSQIFGETFDCKLQ